MVTFQDAKFNVSITYTSLYALHVVSTLSVLISVYRGVLISESRNRDGGVPLYTETSSFQGVGMEEFHCIQTEVSSFQGLE